MATAAVSLLFPNKHTHMHTHTHSIHVLFNHGAFFLAFNGSRRAPLYGCAAARRALTQQEITIQHGQLHAATTLWYNATPPLYHPAGKMAVELEGRERSIRLQPPPPNKFTISTRHRSGHRSRFSCRAVIKEISLKVLNWTSKKDFHTSEVKDVVKRNAWCNKL